MSQASNLRMFFGLQFERGRLRRSIGDIGTPFGAVTLPGKTIQANHQESIPPGGYYRVWSLADSDGFAYMHLAIRGAGVLRVAEYVRATTSPTDATPTGATRSRPRDLSNFGPLIFNTDETLMDNDAALESAIDGSGRPALFSSVNRRRARVVEVWVHNPGTADVDLQWTVIN
jgi:hypothetical protein